MFATLQSSLAATEASKCDSEADLNQQLSTLRQELQALAADKQASEKRLNTDLDDLHRSLLSKKLN